MAIIKHSPFLQRLLSLVALMFLLAGCGRVADDETLKRDVEARLAQALPSGTVEVQSLQRRGSQNDSKAPSGQSRRIIYYDIELKLARDFDFGAWDSPGVAGLVSALGAGPKGIVGITAGGNRGGDIVRAHGTALYQRDGEQWQAVAPGGYAPAAAPAYATDTPPSRAATLLDAMRKVVDAASKDAGPVQAALIEEELAAAHATIRARLARAADGYAIAAGPERGQYLRLVQALSAKQGARTVALVTRGGTENLRLLRAGKVSLALAQGDAALAAYEGRDEFAADGPDPGLRAVASLYPEPLHVLVRQELRAATLADLRGRRIAIGLPGSASRSTALRVLQAHGLRPEDIQPLELSLGESLAALGRGEADALIQVIGLPADSLRDALAELPLRLLPLSERAVAQLAAPGTGLMAFTIPRGSYASQKAEVATVATAALLLAARDLSDAEVAALTRFIFSQGGDLAARGSAQGAQVSAANARLALPIPQHPAALKALEGLAAGPAAAAASAASR
ncbi:TAXI family TRAP transporter solute-binding subunit [Roseateles sp. DAIF2]|uniref:TAXI family TRAP transporter solute-binding subunit n=1 Tax=Roseateles sp. DAIF2 TaxID=2714952 RepID=UPI0018A2FCED|nr:TAXI family TRAP transporter solute-binding subunit [Roseateles sp. DAIF2]QPF71495.1 TAXI family TRAP transporter solute-binding subunit [Roseateles sp. DAIF2]